MTAKTDYSDNLMLFKKYNSGDTLAKEKIISNNLNLVKSIAQRFKNRGVELDDLVEVGIIGLLKAVDGFDIAQGCSFSTYAFPLITGEIKRFLRDDGLIKISRVIKKNSASIMSTRQKYIKEHGQEPKIDELCSLCNLTHEEISEALCASVPAVSLQEKISNGDSELSVEDTIAADDTISAITDTLALQQALNTLTVFESKLIRLRFYKNLTQTETARLLDISQVTVSRAEKKIIDKLRQEIL